MLVDKFNETINKGYTFKKDFITLGTAMLYGKGITGAHVKIPLKTINRHGVIGLDYEPMVIPVELMAISDGDGVNLRSTVTEFGPVLFKKILNLNDNCIK